MPRLPIDYNKTQMYRFVCNDTAVQECYVGSTTNWIKRKAQHKYNCATETYKCYNLKIYQTIRANGGWGNWSMVLIEDYPCDNDLEKRKRERYWQEHYDAKMNSRLAQSSMKEWYETHKEYHKEYRETHKEYQKEYYETHKKQIANQRGEKVTCKCGCIVSRNKLQRHQRTLKHLELISLKI